MTVDTSNLGKFYIGGQWVAPHSRASMPVLNPADEGQIGIVPLGDATDVDAAVALAFVLNFANHDAADLGDVRDVGAAAWLKVDGVITDGYQANFAAALRRRHRHRAHKVRIGV